MRKEPSIHILLETERLVLRRFTEDDADNIFDLDSDPEVMRFLTGGEATPRSVIEADIVPDFLRWHERYEGFGYFAAIEKASGGFLGWLLFRPCKCGSPDNIELGYRLRKSAWGKGYATEGSRALIHKGFTELGVRRIFAETMEVNLASRRVMEKAGLSYVRTFHPKWEHPIEGAEHGEVEYALHKEEWEKLKANG